MKIFSNLIEKRRIKKLIDMALKEKKEIGEYDPDSDTPENNKVIIDTIKDVLKIEKLRKRIDKEDKYNG